MFSRKEHLARKTGENGVGRYDFLKQLINEFTTTRSFEAKRETLANLANFAYDPINYEYMKQLHVVDLFLAQLSESSEELIHFALAGLCNISSDPECKEYIVSLNGIHLISQQLNLGREDICLNALTTLYYLLENEPTVPADIIKAAEKFKKSDDQRFANLGAVFLE